MALTLTMAACAPESQLALGRESPIIGGQPATDYPAACNIDESAGYNCSGSLIAPRVILTAAHCVKSAGGPTPRTMVAARCPFHPDPAIAGRELKVKPEGLWHPKYGTGNPFVTPPYYYDIGVVFLDEAVTLPSYLEISTSVPTVGMKIVRLGRVLDGQQTKSMYVSSEAEVSAVEPYGLFVNVNPAMQGGDSGGPDIDVQSGKIVAVNSVYSVPTPTTDQLARVDVAADWISEQVAPPPPDAGPDSSPGFDSSPEGGASDQSVAGEASAADQSKSLDGSGGSEARRPRTEPSGCACEVASGPAGGFLLFLLLVGFLAAATGRRCQKVTSRS